MGTVRKDIHIEAPIEVVHNFGHDPKRWEEWYMNFRGPKKLTGEGEAGTIVEAEYTLMGIHIPIRIEVIEDEVGHWEGKITGAMQGEQIIDVVPEGNGSHVEMKWTYSLSNKVLNKVADNRVAEKIMERSLEQTMENWKMMCETKH